MRRIQKKICREELVSRIPSLFPYYEYNEIGQFVRHKATDSINGSYGKIVCGFVLPVPLIIDTYFINSDGGYDISETVLLDAEKSYSYRTLMSVYHRYKDTYSHVIKKQIQYYRYNPKTGDLDRKTVCNKILDIDDYNVFCDDMGGKGWEYHENDIIWKNDYKRSLWGEYVNYCASQTPPIEPTENGFEIWYVDEDKEEGYKQYCRERWIISERYIAVNKLLKNVNIKIVGYEYHTEDYVKFKALEVTGNPKYSNFFQFIEHGIGRLTIDEAVRMYNEEEEKAIEFKEDEFRVPDVIYLATVRGFYDNIYKLWKNSLRYERGDKDFCCDDKKFKEYGGYKMLRLLEYLNKLSIEIADEYYEMENVIDDIKFSIDLFSTNNEIGYLTPDARLWDTNVRKIYKGETYVYVDENGEFASFKAPDGVEDKDLDCYDEEYGICEFPDEMKKTHVEWYKSNDDDNMINGSTESKLIGMRSYHNYLNIYDVSEVPPDNIEWLYYYRVGDISDYEVSEYDESGNPLKVFGNVITSIELDKDNRTVTVTYVENALLKLSEDGYFEVDYEDEGKYCYITFTDTYYIIYTKEWDDFLYDENGSYNFDTYVKSEVKKRGYKKYPLSLYSNADSYDINIRESKKTVPYVRSEYKKPSIAVAVNGEENEKPFSTLIRNTGKYEVDTLDKHNILSVPLFKEDYLTGIHYQPIIDNTAKVERGMSSAFERHIRLGEVKTLSDMEHFQNGSFFKIR